MFAVITVLSLMALAVVLTYSESRKKSAGIGPLTSKDRQKRYPAYLLGLIRGIFKAPGLMSFKGFSTDRIVGDDSARTKWIISGLCASSGYLILSGFFFAFFIRRGLSGLPLLLHVIAGGVFAVCLSAFVYLKARHYALGTGLPLHETGGRAVRPFQTEGPALTVRILFWLITASGFSLILTALASMLTFFPLSVQTELIDVHRYSALSGLLSALAFIHYSQDGKK